MKQIMLPQQNDFTARISTYALIREVQSKYTGGSDIIRANNKISYV